MIPFSESHSRNKMIYEIALDISDCKNHSQVKEENNGACAFCCCCCVIQKWKTFYEKKIPLNRKEKPTEFETIKLK